jgi:pimeloyl-ACP methyl ester carboxylesterase
MPSSSKNGRRDFLRVKMTAFATALLLGLLFPLWSSAETIKPTAQVVLLGPRHDVIAGLYHGSGGNASTAIFVMHEVDNFIGSAPCVELAQRGFTALCAKSQFADQGRVNWDQLALDVGYGVSYLRSLPGIKHVVLVGWSGGGAIMAYYQNVAENGLAACQAAARLDPCGNSLAKLPRTDGVVLLDGIPGIAFVDMSALDPSVAKADGLTRDRNESLYLFNPANGYNSNQLESSKYSQQFIDRYTAAQAERESKLVASAQRLRRQIAEGKADFTNDMPFPVGYDGARIWQPDTSLLAHTKGAYPLITPTNPSGTVQTVYSVRNPAAGGKHASTPKTNDPWGGKGNFTAKTFLSVAAIKAPGYRLTADSIEGVDWASSNTATVSNVAGISAPMLIMSMTGHYWIVPAEMYYQAATKSKSKTLAYVYGALHGFSPCTECTSKPLGPYGDTTGETFNYVAKWLETRFQ